MISKKTPSARLHGGRVAAVTLATLVFLLAGCGMHEKDKTVSQTAAKVNKDEITVHVNNGYLANASPSYRDLVLTNSHNKL